MTASEFSNGIVIEFSGFILELIIISVAVPLIVYLIETTNRRQARFYLLQTIRDSILIYLEILGIRKPNEQLRQDVFEGVIDSLFANCIYGNTEDLILLLERSVEKNKIRMVDSRRIREHLRDVDNLILLSSGINLSSITKDAFRLRLFAYLINDLSQDLDFNNNKYKIDDFRKSLKLYLPEVKAVFYKHKKKVDRAQKINSYVTICVTGVSFIKESVLKIFKNK